MRINELKYSHSIILHHQNIFMKNKTQRIGSIDVFRALTMFLMIFVNDLWSLTNIPDWLGHTAADVDGMGLADVVFPAFLFIVGLSIPFAIGNRKKKQQTTLQISGHIITRSFALIVMGIFMVNLESYNSELAIIHKYWWEILMALGIVLVWNAYPRPDLKGKYLAFVLQGGGILILLFLALIYKGGNAEDPMRMQTHWWGILGLIGWAYFISAFIYVISAFKTWPLVLALIFFNAFNAAYFAGWLEPLSGIKKYIWIVGNGSMPAFTMAGVVVSSLYLKFKDMHKYWMYVALLSLFAVIMFAFGFGTRPAWGISKIWATPAWVGICTGISLVMYAGLFILVDHYHKKNWFRIFEPAGTSTLTCYLIPYFLYPISALLSLQLPIALRTGSIGLMKSMAFAFLVIAITWLFEKARIRLRV